MRKSLIDCMCLLSTMSGRQDLNPSRDLQHEAFKLAFEGLNVCNEQVDQVLESSGGEKRVLDIGTMIPFWRIITSSPSFRLWFRNLVWFHIVQYFMRSIPGRCIDMARRYPNASILGVDIKPQDRSESPQNCSFEVWDVNDGLEKFHGQFDLVHTRFTSGIVCLPIYARALLTN